jgi:hypothetical protein
MRDKYTSFDIATALEALKWDAKKVSAADIAARPWRLATESAPYLSINGLEIRRCLHTERGVNVATTGHLDPVDLAAARDAIARRDTTREAGPRTGWPGMIRAFRSGNASSSDGVNAVAPSSAWTRASVWPRVLERTWLTSLVASFPQARGAYATRGGWMRYFTRYRCCLHSLLHPECEGRR